jgi:hypothetical protein
MTTQQFFKGLFMLLVTAVVTAFGQQPVDYLLLAVTAVSITLSYSGKNLIAVLHSDSPAGALSLINLASGLLIALGTGIIESVGLYLVEGTIIWAVVWKVVLSSAFTYIGTTFFAPQHSTAKVRVFISPSASRALKRSAAVITLLLMVGIGSYAQSPFKGFFHEITPQLIEGNAKAPLTGTWLVRWDVGLTCPAIGLKTDETGKVIGTEGRDFSKLFGGFLFTHVKPDGMRDWGVGGGVTVPYIEGGRYGFAVLGGYSVFRLGFNYDFGLPAAQGLSFLGGITVDLFNLTE